MQELEILNNKIGLLLQKFTAMQTENQQLKAKVTSQQQDIDQLKEQLTQSELQVKTSSADTEGIRSQLDTAITEVDKILALINE